MCVICEYKGYTISLRDFGQYTYLLNVGTPDSPSIAAFNKQIDTSAPFLNYRIKSKINQIKREIDELSGRPDKIKKVCDKLREG